MVDVLVARFGPSCLGAVALATALSATVDDDPCEEKHQMTPEPKPAPEPSDRAAWSPPGCWRAGMGRPP